MLGGVLVRERDCLVVKENRTRGTALCLACKAFHLLAVTETVLFGGESGMFVLADGWDIIWLGYQY